MASCDCVDRYDALFTEAQLKELLDTGGKLQGFWALTILTPEDASPFVTDKSWLDLVNMLVEQAGVSITTLKFRTQPHLLGYEYGLKED
jgi:hypothetical protein